MPRNPRLAPDFSFVPGDEVYTVFPQERPVMGIVRSCLWQVCGLTYEVLWPDHELTYHTANELAREGRVVYDGIEAHGDDE